MSNIAAYPLPSSYALMAPGRSGALAYIRAASLSVWLWTLVLRFWWIGDWFQLIQGAEEDTTKTYFYFGFGTAFLAHLTLGPTPWLAAPFTVMSTWSGRLFTVFCVLELLLAPFSAAPRASVIYSIGTWGVFAMLCLYWQSDYRIVRRMTVLAGIVLLAWIFALLTKHGLSRGFGTTIGGANRNMTSQAAVGGLVLCMLSTSRSIRGAAIASALFLSVIVTSRGSIVAICVFLAVYHVVTKGTVRAIWHGVLALSLVGIIFLIGPTLRDLVLEDILHLHDRGRGIGSGFSGRFEYWREAMDGFWKKPIFGYGFRASTFGQIGVGAIHSGYLRLFLDAGLVGGILMILAVVFEGLRRLRLAMQFTTLTPLVAPGIDLAESARINAVACATLAMTLVFWIYEQQYVNIGAVISLVFFLMMAAPAYITTQGVAMRR